VHGDRSSGRKLMTAGAIVTLIGFGIVAVKVWRVPEYWVPVFIGVGIFLIGAIRWLTAGRD
jgi:hypothetical protein